MVMGGNFECLASVNGERKTEQVLGIKKSGFQGGLWRLVSEIR